MMFQIAAAFAMASKKGTTASFPNLNSHLIFIDNNTNTLDRPRRIAAEYRQLFATLDVSPPHKELPIIRFPFHYENIEVPKDCWIDGFFQSEKYFIEYRNEILSHSQFTPTEQISDFLNSYSNLLCDNTLSLHVRRGDYLKFPLHHPPLTLEYYQNATFEMEPFDCCLVFSDDLVWCQDNFKDDRFVFINEKDYFELFLMSKCKNHIISNSSFSWWGAWLNPNEDKRVISPKEWFGPQIVQETKDLYCDGWIVR